MQKSQRHLKLPRTCIPSPQLNPHPRFLIHPHVSPFIHARASQTSSAAKRSHSSPNYIFLSARASLPPTSSTLLRTYIYTRVTRREESWNPRIARHVRRVKHSSGFRDFRVRAPREKIERRTRRSNILSLALPFFVIRFRARSRSRSFIFSSVPGRREPGYFRPPQPGRYSARFIYAATSPTTTTTFP